MFRKTIDLEINTKVNNDKRLIHNVGRNNYRAVGYIDVDVYFGDTKVDLSLKSLWDILHSQELLEDFRHYTLKCIEELKEDFSKRCDGKVLERDTEYYDYLKDVCIDYYESGYFCIVVCAKNGLDNMEEYWNKFLDEEWEKYESKEEISERC